MILLQNYFFKKGKKESSVVQTPRKNCCIKLKKKI